MDKITIDYHGMTVNQALVDLENRITTSIPCELVLITGRGKIREALIQYLDRTEIEWTYENFNKGCIRVAL